MPVQPLCGRLPIFFRPRLHLPSSSPRGGEEGGQGEGEGRQACSAAPALNPAPPVSIASRQRLWCLQTFTVPYWRCHIAPHYKTRSLMRRIVARHFSRRPYRAPDQNHEFLIMRSALVSITPTNFMHVPTAIPIRVVSPKVQDAGAHPMESVTESVLTSEVRYKGGAVVAIRQNGR